MGQIEVGIDWPVGTVGRELEALVRPRSCHFDSTRLPPISEIEVMTRWTGRREREREGTERIYLFFSLDYFHGFPFSHDVRS